MAHCPATQLIQVAATGSKNFYSGPIFKGSVLGHPYLPYLTFKSNRKSVCLFCPLLICLDQKWSKRHVLSVNYLLCGLFTTLLLTISAAHPCSNAQAVTFLFSYFVETQTSSAVSSPPTFYLASRCCTEHTLALHVLLLALRKHTLFQMECTSANGLHAFDFLTPDDLDMVSYKNGITFQAKGSLKNEAWGRAVELVM
jgi:hypothetical protein